MPCVPRRGCCRSRQQLPPSSSISGGAGGKNVGDSLKTQQSHPTIARTSSRFPATDAPSLTLYTYAPEIAATKLATSVADACCPPNSERGKKRGVSSGTSGDIAFSGVPTAVTSPDLRAAQKLWSSVAAFLERNDDIIEKMSSAGQHGSATAVSVVAAAQSIDSTTNFDEAPHTYNDSSDNKVNRRVNATAAAAADATPNVPNTTNSRRATADFQRGTSNDSRSYSNQTGDHLHSHHTDLNSEPIPATTFTNTSNLPDNSSAYTNNNGKISSINNRVNTISSSDRNQDNDDISASSSSGDIRGLDSKHQQQQQSLLSSHRTTPATPSSPNTLSPTKTTVRSIHHPLNSTTTLDEHQDSQQYNGHPSSANGHYSIASDPHSTRSHESGATTQNNSLNLSNINRRLQTQYDSKKSGEVSSNVGKGMSPTSTISSHSASVGPGYSSLPAALSPTTKNKSTQITTSAAAANNMSAGGADIVAVALEAFELHRRTFNLHQKTNVKESHWNRKAALRTLSMHLWELCQVCMLEYVRKPQLVSAASKQQQQQLSKSSLAVLPKDQVPVYNSDGLKVYKKEFGTSRYLIRAEYVVPVSPEQYWRYASDIKYRKEWDSNVAEVHIVETIDESADVCYVATNRIATVYPRDVVNLRMLQRFNPSIQNDTESGGSGGAAQAEVTEYLKEVNGEGFASCSCSIDHPQYDESGKRVRADLRLGAYVAIPVAPPHSRNPNESWSRIFLFNEGDPKGWIPAPVSKMFASRVIPGVIERIVSKALDHYGFRWKDEVLPDPKSGKMKKATSALAYCHAKACSQGIRSIASL